MKKLDTIKLNQYFPLLMENQALFIFLVATISTMKPFQQHFSKPGGSLQKCNSPDVSKVIIYVS